MNDSTVSAKPENLFLYASASEQIDHDILTEASRLLRIIETYETKCQEPSFRENASPKVTDLKNFCYDNLQVSSWVKVIARQFLVADSIWSNPQMLLKSSVQQIVFASLLPGISVSFYPLLSNVPKWLFSVASSKEQTSNIPDSTHTLNPTPSPASTTFVTKSHAPVSKSAGSLSGSVHASDDKRGVAIDINRKDRVNYPNPDIHSIRAGKVVKTGHEDGGYGNYVKVLQDDGLVVLYAHLAEKSPFNPGDPVKAGDVIGNMGKTGRSTGVHLHLEFRQPKYNNEGVYITDQKDFWSTYSAGKFDPIQYLKDNDAWIVD